jgi:hypothetical protein
MNLRPETEGALIQKAYDLERLSKDLTRLAIEKNVEEQVFNIIWDYYAIKNEVIEILIDYPVSKISNPKARDILNRIVTHEGLYIEQIAQNILRILRIKEDAASYFSANRDARFEELSWDLLYSWFGPIAYVESLARTGFLILGTSVPESFHQFIDQARQCIAFQQYLAVYSLCRTILEIAVRDVGQKSGKLPRDHGNVKEDILRRFSTMKNKVVPTYQRPEIEKIYDKASGLIHGNKVVGETEALDLFDRTLKAVHNLYESYGHA